MAQALVLASQGHPPAQAAADRFLELRRQYPGWRLSRVLEGLPVSDRENLRSQLGAASLNELISLGEEGDAELFFSGLLRLTGSAARNRNAAWAATLYQGMAEGLGAFAAIPPSLRARAREEAEVLQGGGSFGRRAEHFAGHFVREASDPSMILGMGVAGLAFSTVRMGALANLAARPASAWTRGLGARFLASSAAFPAEVLAFWGTGRAVTATLHPENLRWDRETLSHELASQVLTLGFLKLSGAASSHLFDRFHGLSAGSAAGAPAFTRFSRQAFHQLGMFGGIAAGHYAETRLGLRPDTGNLWSDSFLTLVHFNAGARIANTVLGPAHAARLRAIEARTEMLGRPRPSGEGVGPFGRQTFAVTPEGLRLPLPEEPPARANILMMSNEGSDGRWDPAQRVSGDPAAWHVAGTCKSILRALIEGELPIAERFQMSQFLLGHMEAARSIYDRLYQSDMKSGEGRPIGGSWKNLDVLLHSINRQHFETLSDTLFEWNNRFRFLQSELRQRANTGGQRQRRNMRRLLDSVDLKYLETRRYLNDAESYLGDDKGFGDGPRSKSVFAAENYPRLIQRFLDINSRLERYIQGKSDLEGIFKAYRSNPIERRLPEIAPAEMSAAIEAAGLSGAASRRLEAALERDDFFLRGQDRVSLHRMLRVWAAEPDLRMVAQGRRALEKYLNVTEEIWNLLDAPGRTQWDLAHDEIVGDRFATEALRQKLTIPLESRVEDAEAVVTGYFETARRLQNLLVNHRPQPRAPTAPEWPELRGQLLRLRDRGVLGVETVNGLLRWFEPPETERSSNLILNMRGDAVSGLIDFLRKGSHSEIDRREISNFLGEVVGRRDHRMLGVLSIYFQSYQLGMMRDRLQIRNRPSADALSDQLAKEAYDQFLEAMRSTARYYAENRDVRGPFFEVFLKLERGHDDNNAQLAAPILHAAQRLVGDGYQVELLGRGGSGEGVFLARSSKDVVTATVSSIREPLTSRDHLEHWLDRAERELLHNGDYQKIRNGKERLVLILQIPHIRSGVKRENIQIWARDYLEAHPGLAEIQLVIPDKGNNVVNPLDSTFFQVARVTRALPTTEALIENQLRDLESSEGPWSAYASLIQMRRELAEHRSAADSELARSFRYPDPVAYWEQRIHGLQQMLVAASAAEASPQSLLNTQNLERRVVRTQQLLAEARRIQRLNQDNWDLLANVAPRFIDDRGYRRLAEEMWSRRAVSLEAWGWNSLSQEGTPHQSTEVPYPSFEQRRAWFQEAVRMMVGIEFPAARLPELLDLSPVGYRVGSLHWRFLDRKLSLNGDLIPPGGAASAASVPGEPDTGTFGIGFSRDPRQGTRRLEFSTLTLPPHLRGNGVGTHYFAELIRLANRLNLDTIESPDTSGDHRYTMAVYGMRFRNPDERRRIVIPFDGWLTNHIMKIPELRGFDTSFLSQIQSPRQVATAHFDPSVGRLVLQPWAPGGMGGNGPAEIPRYYEVGRQFLLSESRSYHGVFDLAPNSYSMRTFREYLRRRFPNEVPPEEEN
ncbi:MAG TPA: hypothetical protein VJR29_04605 [bacterium]|nr:hypothetical protein [bacterium]